jgi:hypothetical protein
MSFICTSILAICAQQWLGIGYVVLKGGNTFVYSNFKTEYICQASSNIYSCQVAPIEASQAPTERP